MHATICNWCGSADMVLIHTNEAMELELASNSLTAAGLLNLHNPKPYDLLIWGLHTGYPNSPKKWPVKLWLQHCTAEAAPNLHISASQNGPPNLQTGVPLYMHLHPCVGSMVTQHDCHAALPFRTPLSTHDRNCT